ncbi:hypothetical protein [Streptomyces sp. WM6372]|uniref:hypothetical protein n=1 Tax=Streptomyces sp. WM6372 TaxID=1415555 RepID=UPI0018FEB856|nr:hypothetical protein [Streptomyces sp. WM6372]
MEEAAGELLQRQSLTPRTSNCVGPSPRAKRDHTRVPRDRLHHHTRQLQAVGGSEQGLEHALSLVQRIERADYAFDQRLVLLKGNPQARPADHLDLLADHAPVGFSERMDAVTRFLKEGTPLERPVTPEL